MNNAKEIVEASGTVIIKNLTKILPLGSVAVEIYEELQSKQAERKVQRLVELYINLSEKVNAVENKINHEFISKDDFLDVFEETTRYVVLERQEQKRRFFQNILVNSMISTECDYDKTERYYRLLDNLGMLELNVLAVLDDPGKYNKEQGMIIGDTFHSAYMTVSKEVSALGGVTKLLNLKVHQAEEAVTVLFSNGLVVENSMNKHLNTNGNAVHVLDNLLTIRGRDFVRFLKDVK